MANTEFYLSFGRHGRYGNDTAIMREDMLSAYLCGKYLKEYMPKCTAIYHSPLARAVETARFTALGLQCEHLLETDFLEESSPTFQIRTFLNKVLINSDNSVLYYHFVTHLPIIEKLGLPFLAPGESCLLSADSKQDMLAENFRIQLIKKPEIPLELLRKFPNLNNRNSDYIYNKLALMK